MTDWKLLTRYVTGECTNKEHRAVQRWATEDSSNQATLRHLEQRWQGAEQEHRWDVDAAWEQFARKNNVRNETTGRRSNRAARIHSSPRTKRARPQLAWESLVLVLLAVVTAGYLWTSWTGTTTGETTFGQVTTRPGERARVTLGDGTKVYLGVVSTLHYPRKFSGKRRGVSLKGAAYFDVAHDASRPFVIAAGSTTTRVLGTAFSVSAYPRDSTINVAVREGQIAFKGLHDATARVVTAGQVGTAHPGGRTKVTTPGDLRTELGWIDGDLVFENTPFDVVLRRLERWYAIEGTLADAELARRRLTATLTNEPLALALDAIATALDMRYTFSETRRTVTFYSR